MSRLLPTDAEPELPSIVQYIFRVLDALQITNGAMHCEVYINSHCVC